MTYPVWARWEAIDPDGGRYVFEHEPFEGRHSGATGGNGSGWVFGAAYGWKAREESRYACIGRAAAPKDWMRTKRPVTGQMRLW